MKQVVVVGVGALGSHVVQFLRNEDVRIKVVDFDRVERKNVLSQFHAKSTVGKSKTAGLAQTMNFLYAVKIDGVPHKLTDDNVEELVGDADLIIDCLDNAEARDILTQYGWDGHGAGAPILHGALAPDGGFGRVIWNDGWASDDAVSGAATCEDGEHLPFIALIAAQIARAAQVYLRTGQQLGCQVAPNGASFTV